MLSQNLANSDVFIFSNTEFRVCIIFPSVSFFSLWNFSGYFDSVTRSPFICVSSPPQLSSSLWLIFWLVAEAPIHGQWRSRRISLRNAPTFCPAQPRLLIKSKWKQFRAGAGCLNPPSGPIAALSSVSMATWRRDEPPGCSWRYISTESCRDTLSFFLIPPKIKCLL